MKHQITAGPADGLIESFDDSFSGTIRDDNVVRELVKAGKSWKCYAESIPAPGYVGTDSGVYVRRHNPFSYLFDVQNSSAQAANIVPFTQFATDLANNALPQYSFIAPNVDDDAHDGSLAQADTWLQSNVIVPLTASPAFQSSLLIITFDESDGRGADAATDCCAEQGLPGEEQLPGITGPGGGRVGAVMISPCEVNSLATPTSSMAGTASPWCNAFFSSLSAITFSKSAGCFGFTSESCL